MKTQSQSDNSKLPESMKKACCETCLLSKAMRDCASCPFNKYAKREISEYEFADLAYEGYRMINQQEKIT